MPVPLPLPAKRVEEALLFTVCQDNEAAGPQGTYEAAVVLALPDGAVPLAADVLVLVLVEAGGAAAPMEKLLDVASTSVMFLRETLSRGT